MVPSAVIREKDLDKSRFLQAARKEAVPVSPGFERSGVMPLRT